MGSPRASLGVRLFFAALGVIGCMGVLVFGAAGTLDYWQGWLSLADYFVANGLVGIWLLRHDRALLERRMRAGPTAETDPAQQVVMAIAIPLFLALLIVPGLGRRFDWAAIPTPLVFVGAALIALSWWVIFQVFRENAYT